MNVTTTAARRAIIEQIEANWIDYAEAQALIDTFSLDVLRERLNLPDARAALLALRVVADPAYHAKPAYPTLEALRAARQHEFAEIYDAVLAQDHQACPDLDEADRVSFAADSATVHVVAHYAPYLRSQLPSGLAREVEEQMQYIYGHAIRPNT